MKTLRHFTSLIIFISLFTSCTQNVEENINFRAKKVDLSDFRMRYESGNWEHPNYTNAFESFGNHRIVIEVKDPTKLNQAIIPWRRRDDQPQNKAILIVDALTNQPIENKYILKNTNEIGHLIFEPNKTTSRYYVYYLPHYSTGSYYPKLAYKKADKLADESWFKATNLSNTEIKSLAKAKIISAQSLDDFHSFFPMEIIASKNEFAIYTQNNLQSFYLFPEYRERPIKMQDYLPVHWIAEADVVNGISDVVKKGEYFTFQIGIYAPNLDLKDIKLTYTGFKGKRSHISKDLITCFNTEGVDLNGKSFNKKLAVKANKVQALWFGVEVPKDAKEGDYYGQFVIKPNGLTADTVHVKLEVSSELIANYGDDAPENMSRLRWLNSTIGTDKDFIIKPFTPVKVADKSISILGRELLLNEFGLPKKISSYFTQEMTSLKTEPEEILAQAMKLSILNKNKQIEQWSSSPYTISQDIQSEASWESNSSSENFTMKVSGHIEYDGMLDYKIELIAKKAANIKDIKFQIPMQKDAAEYIIGLGLKGGEFRKDIAWKWDVKKHQEGAWLGAINKGLQFVLRDENYERPLNTNFYHTKPLNLPYSWYNDHNGGINIQTKNDIVNIENYSGARAIQAGDTLHFNIRFLITPFKTIDTKEHFSTRFVHKYVPVDTVLKWKGTIVNVHHANEINPYINYPFYNIEKQKAYIEEAHSKDLKVKLYNTIRELTYKSHELFALKSLGDEVLNDGEGGGHSWLQEHFKANYHSAWHATRVNDASILNKGNSRWTNYYIEGINWLAKNQKIDGLYLDDIAFSRTTVKRIASVLNKNRGPFVIDLHSANQYNNRDGFTNSAFLYMEHFPYISRLWFGEYFEYDLAPDYWMTEVSGLPFGLTGEMLQDGGHPYRGLVYGMTKRVYGNHNPKALWNLFDEFDIANSEMLGYWVDRSPIKINHKGIKSSIYLHPDKVLITIGSWSAKNENVKLKIDWEALGLQKNYIRLYSPKLEGLQEYREFELNKGVSIEKNQGLILILEKK